jgi:hypothetical protein
MDGERDVLGMWFQDTEGRQVLDRSSPNCANEGWGALGRSDSNVVFAWSPG